MVRVKTAGVATGFEPIAPGIYDAIFTKYAEQASKKAGQGDVPKDAMSFNAVFTVTGGGEEDTVGRQLFIWGSLQDHALFSIKRVGVAVGVPDEILEDEDGWDPKEVLPDYYTQEVKLKVTMGEYQGKPSNNVDVLLEGEGAVAAGGGWN